jgi:hypothetical protein
MARCLPLLHDEVGAGRPWIESRRRARRCRAPADRDRRSRRSSRGWTRRGARCCFAASPIRCGRSEGEAEGRIAPASHLLSGGPSPPLPGGSSGPLIGTRGWVGWPYRRRGRWHVRETPASWGTAATAVAPAGAIGGAYRTHRRGARRRRLRHRARVPHRRRRGRRCWHDGGVGRAPRQPPCRARGRWRGRSSIKPSACDSSRGKKLARSQTHAS